MNILQGFLDTMDGCFNGKERLELLEPIGRPMRKGSPEDLRVPDRARVLAALDSGDEENAWAYLEVIRAGHIDMFLYLYEWAVQYPDTLGKYRPGQATECASLAFKKWKEAVSRIGTGSEQDEAIECLDALLTPRSLLPGTPEQFRAARSQGAYGSLSGLLERIGGAWKKIQDDLSGGRFKKASHEFGSYWSFACAIHDGLVQYIQSFCEAVSESFGQEFTERVLVESFSSCSFFERFWALPLILNTNQAAAFIAEHLRFHFSGGGRRGSVEIIEKENCYQLIFAPCGSGGAMRRRQTGSGINTAVLSNPSPATWNRSNEVPGYCTHCAFNELESLKRFGYPVFVTGFDPDPFKPCVWIVYKDPDLIPEEYFTRMGFKKDPSKFKKQALSPDIAGVCPL